MNVTVWAVSRGNLEGHLVGTGECGGMAVSSGYLKGQLVGTGECGGMGRIERLFRGTVGGHW